LRTGQWPPGTSCGSGLRPDEEVGSQLGWNLVMPSRKLPAAGLRCHGPRMPQQSWVPLDHASRTTHERVVAVGPTFTLTTCGPLEPVERNVGKAGVDPSMARHPGGRLDVGELCVFDREVRLAPVSSRLQVRTAPPCCWRSSSHARNVGMAMASRIAG